MRLKKPISLIPRNFNNRKNKLIAIYQEHLIVMNFLNRIPKGRNYAFFNVFRAEMLENVLVSFAKYDP